MGTITSGTGLISGLDIDSIVKQLMAIESQTRDNVQSRIETLTAQQTALTTLQARVLAIQAAAASFNKENVFQQKAVASSNEDVLTASATRFAAIGNYQFRVKRLATNQHLVSNSYSSLSSSVGSGTMTFEMGQGQLARETNLNFINGQQGFSRGSISIQDRDGNQADIDLSSALTVQDIIDAINGNSTIQVSASVSGDHLVITDQSGGDGDLIVSDVDGGSTATDLGIRKTLTVADGNVLDGDNINYLTASTRLKSLNDGNGVRGLEGTSNVSPDLSFNWGDIAGFDVALSTAMFGDDDSEGTTVKSLNSGAGIRMGTFRITDQNGAFVDINMNDFQEKNGDNATVAQLKTYIEDQAFNAGMKVKNGSGDYVSSINVSFQGLDHITITDNSSAVATDEDGNRYSHFIIEDLDGGHAAADLGIENDVNYSTITGEQVWYMDTLGDVMNAINNHYANVDINGNRKVEVSINAAGTGLQATNLNADDFSDPMTITTSNTNKLEQWAGEDLGLLTGSSEIKSGESYTGRRLIAGLNSTLLRSLNGGNSRDTMVSGEITYGENHILGSETLTLTDSNGIEYEINLANENIETVQDLIDKINEQTKIDGVSQIQASINSVGNGLVLTDQAGGTGTMVVNGSLAEKLGIEVSADDNVTSIDSGNLQLQYVNGSTLLSDMRQGQGIRRGIFTITDSTGVSYDINLNSDSINTLNDVIDAINSASKGGTFSKVQARINDSGDGIMLWDEGGAFSVSENGGQTAHDLRILGQSVDTTDGVNKIDGSYELRLDVGGGDSIEDIVDMINEADVGIQASVINVGSANDPAYRISFNSQVGGRAGRVYLDAGSTSLTTTTLAKGDDAIVLFGEGESGQTLLVSSSSNTIDNVVKGVTLELNQASDTPVQVSVDQDIDNVVEQIQSFVSAYNDAMKSIAEITSYDPDTQQQGVLFADYTVRSIEYGLESIMNKTYTNNTTNRLGQIGLSFKSLGTETTTDNGETSTYAVVGTLQINFDETKFREAFAEDPDAVTTFFTQVDTGFGDAIADELDKLAGTSQSTASNRIDAMQSRKQLFQDRVDYLDERLSAKETSLYNQFYAMEEALASLQSQQSSLSQLSAMAASYSS